MSNSRMLSRLVLAALVAALIAAPAASAMPSDPLGTAVVTQDARGEAAASGGGTGAGITSGPINLPSFPGPPAWPENPMPLPPRAVPLPGGDGDGGVDLPVVLLVIAGTLALGGGMAVAANRVQTRTAL